MRRGTLLDSSIADTPSPSSLPPPLLFTHHAEDLQQQQSISVDSDTVVILASLLCALICVAGLALVARCACRRGRAVSVSAVSLATTTTSSGTGRPQPPPPPRGLEKAAIEALPTVTVSVSLKARNESSSECCAICLAAFAEGDQLRVLPHCAHGFHASCVDTWLAAHASCPFCRATIVSVSPPPLCRRCGAACCDQQKAAPAVAAPEPPHPLMPNGQGTENRRSTSQIPSMET